MTDQPFSICLTMAGAVSAGAYTAGVMDYLLETLDLWEAAKAQNRSIRAAYPADYLDHGYDPSVPMHEVCLEVISGASAGGINGTLSVVSLLEGMEPYHSGNAEGKNNKLYKSWVEMADGEGDTFGQLLARDDLNGDRELRSLLNTQPIDGIADRALQIGPLKPFPPYVSKDLDLILTVSNLRGIEFLIDFEGRDREAATKITSHSGFFRYRIQHDQLPAGMSRGEALYFVLDLEDPKHRHYLKNATLSTAAFPIGLSARSNAVPREYIERYGKYLFGEDRGVLPNLNGIPEEYHFDSVDGGLINNEPFGYALRALREKRPELDQAGQGNYAMIMINPFPNYQREEKHYQSRLGLKDLPFQLIKVLRNQAMFKQDDILEALDMSERTRFLIAPSRKERVKGADGQIRMERAAHPLACGALDGFSGFLDRRFRHHDFVLGRQNCQSFLRYYFALAEGEWEAKLNRQPSPEALERFGIFRPPGTPEAQAFFPIIPDMRVLKASENRYAAGPDADIVVPDFPKLDFEHLRKAYNKALSGRLKAIAKKLLNHWAAYSLFRTVALGKFKKKIWETIRKELEGHGLVK